MKDDDVYLMGQALLSKGLIKSFQGRGDKFEEGRTVYYIVGDLGGG